MKTVMVHRHGRLEMYREGADTPAYWDAHWREHPPETMAGMGVYIGFRGAIERFMPRDGLIVEAGCGNGNTARTIRAAGFEVEGVDFAPQVIAANRAIDPGGRYRIGDVRALEYASGSLAGYISLGVVEHFDDATRREILKEAARCLRPGGVALVTVPHYNALRTMRYGLLARGAPARDVPFYQYFLRAGELVGELRAVGLRVELVDGYDAYKGLKDTLGCKGLLDRARQRGARWRRLVDHPPKWMRAAVGHMLLVVAVKPGEASALRKAA